MLRTGRQANLLVPVYSFRRTAECVVSAVSYLNKDQGVFIPQDEVNFSPPAAEIALQQGKAA